MDVRPYVDMYLSKDARMYLCVGVYTFTCAYKRMHMYIQSSVSTTLRTNFFVSSQQCLATDCFSYTFS